MITILADFSLFSTKIAIFFKTNVMRQLLPKNISIFNKKANFNRQFFCENNDNT
jgi:hypothetical protein